MRRLGRALLAALLLGGCGPAEPVSETVGQPVSEASTAEAPDAAPDFTLADLAGRPVTLSEHRGKTVIVDFWATWCPPCVFQVPELNKLAAAHAESDDLVVIGVSVDVDGVEVVASWVEEQGVAYTIVMGDEDLAREFGALGFPTLVVVTPDGRIDSRHVGLIEYQHLEELVAALAPARST
jgi:thiol-disulfide isomerase/thioredoxin